MPAMRTPAHLATSRSVVVALVCAGILAAITTIAQRYGFSTLAVTRGAALSALDGHGFYAYRAPGTQLGTALPPPAALLVLPAALLPLPLAGWLLALAGIAALTLALIVQAGPIARRHGRRAWPVVLAVGALGLTLEPIRAALGFGTLDLLVYGLVTADLVALSRATRHAPGGRCAGVGIGLATACSVSSAFFIGYLLVTRRHRAALTALATAAGSGLIALAVLPRETTTWFGEVLWRIDREGPVEAVSNQSLAGVLARVYESSTTPVLLWLSFALLLVAVGLIRARAAYLDGDELTAITLVGLAAACAGPVTGTHELVWVLPAMLVLCDRAARCPRPGLTLAAWAAGGLYLIFLLAPMWSFSGQVARNSYALVLVLLVNLLPWRTPPPLRGS